MVVYSALSMSGVNVIKNVGYVHYEKCVECVECMCHENITRQ